MFRSLLKAVVGTVIETPIAVVADIVTLGGVTTSKDETYTGAAIKKVMENIEKASDPE